MKKYFLFFLLLIFSISSCRSYELTGDVQNDFQTSGALSDDCFQVIITAVPDKELKTMADQRENSFIKAKNSIVYETERQILNYYTTVKSVSTDAVSAEKKDSIRIIASGYTKKGIIEQEYYLIDNSAVLVYRIFKNGIKNEILNN